MFAGSGLLFRLSTGNGSFRIKDGFSLILNKAMSDDDLKRRLQQVNIIIIIIMFIDCKWVDTRWQWSFNMLHMHGLRRLII